MQRCVALALRLTILIVSTSAMADDRINGWKTDRLDRGTPAVYHQAVIFPRLALNNLVFECANDILKVEVIGFKPLQKFPQPEMLVRLGTGAYFSRVATATYKGPSAPEGPINIPQEKLDDNLKGKGLSWPGHPAYASLAITMPTSARFFEAFVNGGPVEVSFATQKLVFPKMDPVVAAKFVELCKGVGLAFGFIQ